MSKEVTCPSGMSGVIRGLKGKEAKHLSDRQAVRSGMFMDQILASCWEQTTDPGPYEMGEQGLPDWSKVLVGDRTYVFVQIRAETFGSDYDFPVQCDKCRETFDWTVDLLKLPIKALSPEDSSAFSQGNRIEGEIPWEGGQRKFWFKLNTGDDEVRMAKQRRQQKIALSNLVLYRVQAIDGVEDHQRRKFFEEAPFKAMMDVLHAMDEHDCGIDTSFEVECPECLAQTEVELPFGRNFFFPKEAKGP